MRSLPASKASLTSIPQRAESESKSTRHDPFGCMGTSKEMSIEGSHYLGVLDREKEPCGKGNRGKSSASGPMAGRSTSPTNSRDSYKRREFDANSHVDTCRSRWSGQTEESDNRGSG